MEDPVNTADESHEERRRREQEEALEQLLLQQEQEQEQDHNVMEEDLVPLLDDNAAPAAELPQVPQAVAPQLPFGSIHRVSYTQASLMAAVALLMYALRTRKQWYLALVFIRSSKAAYIVLANALIATCVGIFRGITKAFLGGLRLHEAEGVGDFFRWNVTETCLALTMFRSELTVSNGILFLLLVLAKCLHWVADLREGHLRVTEESIVVIEEGLLKGWPILQWQHAKLWIMLILLQLMDIFAVQWCGHDIMTHGPSVSILFGFEAAILLVSAWNNLVLWHLHALDGWMHYMHEKTSPNQRMHRWIHPWKEHKATFTFAVEVQAQALKFLFYVIFFAIVLTYYGIPINLFREVYVSFQALKQRLVAFAKYRRLMASMNRFQSVAEQELEDAGHDCIICRDDMTIADCKKLPGCGHIFHKSCLREWLVQQQSCPTCRGDITAMEAARRTAAQARATEGEPAPAGPSEETTGAPVAAATPLPMEQQTQSGENNATKWVQPGAVIEAQAPFPALYRVVKDEGADVWDETFTNVIRTVPFGYLVLCTTLHYKQEDGFMMRLPDGWCKEDTMVRVRTLASLKQTAQDNH